MEDDTAATRTCRVSEKIQPIQFAMTKDVGTTAADKQPPVVVSAELPAGWASVEKEQLIIDNKDDDNRRESNDNPEETNSYVELREAKIARNEARLRELGLLSFSSQSKQCVSPAPSSKARLSTANSSPPAATRAPARRSKRLQDLSLVSGENSAEEAVTGNEVASKSPPKRRRVSAAVVSPPPEAAPLTQPISFSSIARARDVSIHVGTLLFGNSESSGGTLGRRMASHGKAWVMMESYRRAATPVGVSSPSGISFNKYSGVQEFGNNVMFLWVNFRNSNCDDSCSHQNEFLKNGRHMTWFGGSRMHEQSPAIQRLLEIGQLSPANTGSDQQGGVVLWGRQQLAAPGSDKFTPYVCYGRLKYVSHLSHSSPLAFVWELLDYDALYHHADESIHQHFRELVHQHASVEPQSLIHHGRLST
jgi:hypothetical protein